MDLKINTYRDAECLEILPRLVNLWCHYYSLPPYNQIDPPENALAGLKKVFDQDKQYLITGSIDGEIITATGGAGLSVELSKQFGLASCANPEFVINKQEHEYVGVQTRIRAALFQFLLELGYERIAVKIIKADLPNGKSPKGYFEKAGYKLIKRSKKTCEENGREFYFYTKELSQISS